MVKTYPYQSNTRTEGGYQKACIRKYSFEILLVEVLLQLYCNMEVKLSFERIMIVLPHRLMNK